MPIFEYTCKNCGHTMELLQRSDRVSAPRCEKCGSKTLQKRFSTFSMGRSASGTKGTDACPTGTCPLG
jgi:putative FmdB family regulatory protein